MTQLLLDCKNCTETLQTFRNAIHNVNNAMTCISGALQLAEGIKGIEPDLKQIMENGVLKVSEYSKIAVQTSIELGRFIQNVEWHLNEQEDAKFKEDRR